MLLSMVLLAAALKPAAAGCPPEPEVPAALGKGEGWIGTCHALPGKAMVLTAAQVQGKVIRLAVAVRGPSPAQGELTLAGPERKLVEDVAQGSENWQMAAAPDRLGGEPVIRVALYGETGEDLYKGQQIVSFFRVEGGKLVHLWTGLGGGLDRRFDACMLETTASFTRKEQALQRNEKTRRTFRDPGGIEPKVAAQLRKECVAPPTRTAEFPLSAEPLGPIVQ
jgi:hypothetical protein